MENIYVTRCSGCEGPDSSIGDYLFSHCQMCVLKKNLAAEDNIRLELFNRPAVAGAVLNRLYHRIFLPIRVRQTVVRIIRISRCSNYPLGTYLAFWKSQLWPPVAEICLFKVFRNRITQKIKFCDKKKKECSKKNYSILFWNLVALHLDIVDPVYKESCLMHLLVNPSMYNKVI